MNALSRLGVGSLLVATLSATVSPASALPGPYVRDYQIGDQVAVMMGQTEAPIETRESAALVVTSIGGEPLASLSLCTTVLGCRKFVSSNSTIVHAADSVEFVGDFSGLGTVHSSWTRPGSRAVVWSLECATSWSTTAGQDAAQVVSAEVESYREFDGLSFVVNGRNFDARPWCSFEGGLSAVKHTVK